MDWGRSEEIAASGFGIGHSGTIGMGKWLRPGDLSGYRTGGRQLFLRVSGNENSRRGI